MWRPFAKTSLGRAIAALAVGSHTLPSEIINNPNDLILNIRLWTIGQDMLNAKGKGNVIESGSVESKLRKEIGELETERIYA